MTDAWLEKHLRTSKGQSKHLDPAKLKDSLKWKAESPPEREDKSGIMFRTKESRRRFSNIRSAVGSAIFSATARTIRVRSSELLMMRG